MSGQSSEILERASITRFFIRLKFKVYIQVSSLDAGKFTFETTDATPITYPFKAINTKDDYNSISRVLTLYFNGVELPPESKDYHLTIAGLRSASGFDLLEETLLLPYSWENDTVTEHQEEPEFTIEDKSIKVVSIIDPSELEQSINEDFYIVSVDPEDESIFLDSDYNNGSIAIEFSSNPNITQISPPYIRVQRRQVGGTSFKWQDVDIKTALDAHKPVVYIYLPSLDATPVYFTDGGEYFESGYKYRVLLSSNLSAALTF